MLKKFLLNIFKEIKFKVNEIERIGKIAEERKSELLTNIREYEIKHGLKYHGINNNINDN